MTLLDAYALIAFLVNGPAASGVRAILREGDAAVATINLAETLDVTERVRGIAHARALEALTPLLDTSLRAVSLDTAIAARAAEIRSAHYHRSKRPISLADAVLIASAGPGDRLATADPDVLAVAAAEHIATIPLPGEA